MMKIRNMLMLSTSLVLMSGVNSVMASTGADFGTTYTSTHHLGWSRQISCGLNCALKRAASNTVPASELSRLSVTHLAAPDIHLSPEFQNQSSTVTPSGWRENDNSAEMLRHEAKASAQHDKSFLAANMMPSNASMPLAIHSQLAPAGAPRLEQRASGQNPSAANFPRPPVVASVCFITDTGACSGNSFGGGGGEEYPSGGQPDWNLDNNKRCRDEGYALTSCSSVQQPSNRCPYNSDIFEKCVCKPSLVSCPAGQVGVGDACDGKYASCQCDPKLVSCNNLQDGQGATCGGKFERCTCKTSLKSCASPYIGIGSSCDGKYTECCNTCPEYTYTQASIPDGYVSGGTCDSCDGVKHKITPNPCTGFPTSCTCGYDTSSASCKSGSATRYKSCKSCCSADYIYDSSNCPSPHKLTGDVCGGKYKKCELDENSVTCENFSMPNGASYAKLVYSCDDLTSAINSSVTGNIVLMKTLTCPTSLTLKSGQNLVSIGYFLKLTQENNDYKNQLNQCFTLTLNNYLYTSDNSKISDITLLNTPLYLKGSTTIRNMNMKIASNYGRAVQASSTSFTSKMSGMVNIYTPGSTGIYNAAITMTDTKLNLRPKGDTNRGFYMSNITINGSSIVNMDLTGSNGNGEAIIGGTTTLNDKTQMNIKTNTASVEAVNGDIYGNSTCCHTNIELNSKDIIFRAKTTTTQDTYPFAWKPHFLYTEGNQIMTISGIYKATSSNQNYFYQQSTQAYGTSIPTGSWTRTGDADFSSSSEFGQQMKIFETNFFK